MKEKMQKKSLDFTNQSHQTSELGVSKEMLE
jgi:hypothetical protein